MAGSIGDVNVRIVADAGGVGPAVQQAQRQFSQFSQTASGGMTRVQGIAQQAVFAVDDFFAAFATGGVAGGIRGAANNLTLMASMLGGIKLQLAAIAGVTAAGFLAKYFFDASKEAEKADEALQRFKDHLSQTSGTVGSNQTLRERLREVGGMRGLGEAFNAATEGGIRSTDLRMQMGNLLALIAKRGRDVLVGRDARLERALDKPGFRATAEISAPEFVAEVDAAKKRQDLLRAEIASNQKLYGELKLQLETQEKINGAIENRIGALNARRGDNFGGLFAGAGAGVAIQALRQSLSPTFGIGELFSRFPTANAFGSSGAISAINAAKYGPSNVNSADVEELKKQTAILNRIEVLERRRGLPIEVIEIGGASALGGLR